MTTTHSTSHDQPPRIAQATPEGDHLAATLLQARMALAEGEDPHLAGLLDAALKHRAATVPPPVDKRITRAVRFIDAHLSDGRITLTMLGRAAGMSPFHFARAFKAATGSTPAAFVLQRRLEVARVRLANDRSAPITSIALSVGFSTPSAFSFAFRQRFGLTPRAWRRRAP